MRRRSGAGNQSEVGAALQRTARLPSAVDLSSGICLSVNLRLTRATTPTVAFVNGRTLGPSCVVRPNPAPRLRRIPFTPTKAPQLIAQGGRV